MNRRPTRVETSYYKILPAHAVLQWQVRMHRNDRKYRYDIKHREFLWTDVDGDLRELEMHIHDGEIRGFGGSPLPAPIGQMTPGLWVEYMHVRHPERELEAFRADGWTVEIWTPPIEQLAFEFDDQC